MTTPNQKRTMKNEYTSARVAKIAGKINRISDEQFENAVYVRDGFSRMKMICTLAEFKALAASALTQARDKAKKK